MDDRKNWSSGLIIPCCILLNEFMDVSLYHRLRDDKKYFDNRFKEKYLLLIFFLFLNELNIKLYDYVLSWN